MFDPGSNVCCIITGASRGYGRFLAVSLAHTSQTCGNNITFILMARSRDGLEETLNQVKHTNNAVNGYCIDGDLGDLLNLPSLLDRAYSSVTPSSFSHTLLINNAGSVGDLSRQIRDFSDPSKLQKYMDINVTSPFLLTSRFLNEFQQTKCYVVNISSLLAVQAMSGFSLYCIGKAARDMLHSVVAKEEDSVRTLNFAPGPLDTDMNNDILANSCNAEAKAMLAKENILKPEQSSDKLVKVLREDGFTSGAHLDYYDC